MLPETKLSNLMRDIKSDSSTFVNENRLCKYRFHWQEGYGAFSYSRSQRGAVIKYIMNQERHHKKKTFREEYLEFLKRYDIEFNDKYLFEFFE